ncbi:MAG: cysteine desulfurase family protein [Chloroflexota bacterium]
MMDNDYIYLDHNATTPVDKRVLDVMLPYFTSEYGNAASDHHAGISAKRPVERARVQCAKVINARVEKSSKSPDNTKEIIFTSGATESDNIALFGVAEKYAHKGNHIITTVTEHKAILDCCERLEAMGKRITYLPVDNQGFIDIDELRQAITPETILISIMFANNEIGTIQPIAEIGKIAREHDILFHTDAAQAMGHVPIDVQAMNIDLLSFSAHKNYGPKGVGGLYVRRRNPFVKVAPVIYGGGHELGMRSGTLNVPAIVGMGESLELANKQMNEDAQTYRGWASMMLSEFQDKLGGIQLNGAEISENRLPNNLNISIEHVESRSLIVNLKNIAIATGSACTSADVQPSHVIKALGYGDDRAHTAIRLGLGRSNSREQVLQAVNTICEEALELRELRTAFL